MRRQDGGSLQIVVPAIYVANEKAQSEETNARIRSVPARVSVLQMCLTLHTHLGGNAVERDGKVCVLAYLEPLDRPSSPQIGERKKKTAQVTQWRPSSMSCMKVRARPRPQIRSPSVVLIDACRGTDSDSEVSRGRRDTSSPSRVLRQSYMFGGIDCVRAGSL